MSPYQDAPRQRSRRSVAGTAGLLATALLLTGCSAEDLGLPRGVTDRTEYVENLWLGAWIAALAVGVFVWGLIGWAVVRYRRRSDDEIPAQIRYHLPIEVLYTVAPVIIVAVLFFHTVQTDLDELADAEADHTVEVIGQKWAWTFTYTDAVDGESVYETGTPADPTELWLPVDEVVSFQMTSNDVIHAFKVPAFNYTMDVIPGRTNDFTVTPIEEGVYDGKCSELCGIYHSRMIFTVRVVDRATFDQHAQELYDAGQVGEPPLTTESTTISGTESSELEEDEE